MKIFKAFVLICFLSTVTFNSTQVNASPSDIPTVVATVAPSTLQTIEAYWNFAWPVVGVVSAFLYVNRAKFAECFTGIGRFCCPGRYASPPDYGKELTAFLDPTLPHNIYTLIEDSYILLRKNCKAENTTPHENLGFSFSVPEDKLRYNFRKFSPLLDTFIEKDFQTKLKPKTVNYLQAKLKNGILEKTFLETALELYNEGLIQYVPINKDEDFYFIAGWEKGIKPKEQKRAFIIRVDQNFNNEDIFEKVSYGTFVGEEGGEVIVDLNYSPSPVTRKGKDKIDLLDK